MFGIAAGGTPRGDYWALRSTLNLYCVRSGADDILYAGSFSEGVVAKFSRDGVLKWSTDLGSFFVYDVVEDSSGNVFITGHTSAYGAGSTDAFLAKLNSSGTLQWLRTLGGVSGDIAYGVDVDSSDNIYIGGDYGGGAGLFVAKYNTSGAIQWQRTLSGGTCDGRAGLRIDSSDGVYIGGRTNTTGNYNAIIAKYNTSGTIQWQRSLGTTSSDLANGFGTDSSDNLYLVGVANGDAFIAKYNSSGTWQWDYKLDHATRTTEFDAVSVDASGNCYGIVETYSVLTTYDAWAVKLNSSGTLQWQLKLSDRGVSDWVPSGIAVNSNSDVTMACYDGAYNDPNVDLIQIAGDGTAAGTYAPALGSETAMEITSSTDLTLAAITLTDAAGTLTDAAGSLTDSSQSITPTTPAPSGRYYEGPL